MTVLDAHTSKQAAGKPRRGRMLAAAVLVCALALAVAGLGVRAFLGEVFAANGARAMQSGELRTAAWSFEKAIGYAPSESGHHLQLGMVKRRQLDAPGAMAEFRRAVSLAPYSVPALVELGRALVMAGETEGAATIIARIRAITPDHWEAAYLSGLNATRAGNLEDALRFFHDALAMPSVDRGIVLLAAAEVALKLGETYEALDYSEKALTSRFEDPALHLVRAHIFDALRDDVEAARSYERVVAIVRGGTPTERDVAIAREALEPLLSLHGRLGEWPAAAEDLDLLLAMEPKEMVQESGAWLLDQWHGAGAEVRDGNAMVRIALVLKKAEAPELAERALRNAAPLLSGADKAFAQYQLAMLLVGANRLGEAETVLRDAQASAPDRFEIGYELGKVLAALGKTDGARLAFMSASALPVLSEAQRKQLADALDALDER